MWEYFIEVDEKDIAYLTQMEKLIKSKYDFCVTALIDNKLTIGCEYSNKIKVLKYLQKIITENLILIYKERYLRNHLSLTYLSGELKLALIKCLVMFDFEEDFFLVYNMLDDSVGIVFNSFYWFKLGTVRKRWQDVCNVYSNNAMLIQSEMFLDLLKFLVDSITPKLKVIDVYFNGNDFVLSDENNNILTFNNDNTNSELNLLTGLITLAPKTINLHCAAMLSDNTFKTIYYLFNKKVNLLV